MLKNILESRLREKGNFFDQLKYVNENSVSDEEMPDSEDWFDVDITTTVTTTDMPTTTTTTTTTFAPLTTTDSDQGNPTTQEQNPNDGGDFEPSSSNQGDQSDQNQEEVVPSYLLGYGDTFVYNNNNNNGEQAVVASNDAYQANSYGVVIDNDNEEEEGSGEYVAPLSCWRCDGAANWGECASAGHLEQCEESATSCQITIRKRDGAVEGIFTGCKQREACENNKSNNFVTLTAENENWAEQGWEDPNQCRPSTQNGPSVCRQCCYANNCNYNLDFMDQQGWSQVLL